MITNEQFKMMMDRYKNTFPKWHRRIAKRIRISKEVYLREFHYTLLKAMINFDIAKAISDTEQFQRYFFSALKKMSNTLIRQESTDKKKAERQFVSFSLKKHDLYDTSVIDPLESVIVEDLMLKCCNGKGDREIIQMRMDGMTMDDVCNSKGIPRHQYRTTISRLRDNFCLLQDL